jgi:hypothetical protein
MAKFAHDAYDLDEKTGMLSRKDGLCLPATAEERNAETCSVLEAVTDFIQAQIIASTTSNSARTGTNDIPWTNGVLDP